VQRRKASHYDNLSRSQQPPPMTATHGFASQLARRPRRKKKLQNKANLLSLHTHAGINEQ
jgi:hypothetical protein